MFGPGSSRPWLRWLLIFSLIFNALFLSAYALGELRARRCSQACGAGCELSKRLGCDAVQARGMQESYARMQAQMGPLRREIATRRENMAKILSAQSPDTSALFVEVDRIAQLQAQAQKLLLKHIVEQDQTLTPAQRGEFHKLLKDRLCPAKMCDKEGGCAAAEQR